MLDRIRSVLQGKCLLNPGQKVVVGVSGGPDSSCLLNILLRLGYTVVIAHFDHSLRPESKAEAEDVKQLAAALDVPYEQGCEDVAAYAQNNHLSIEEAARTARYRFLFDVAERSQAQAVAVGHTADDQVETVLMHLLRGAGLAGLKGMHYRALPNAFSRELPLVRPLLGVWRDEVLAYNQALGLPYNLDASNTDTRFYRNRLRQELIPYLQTYNPQVKQVIWRTADILREDDSILEQLVASIEEESVEMRGPGYVAFNAAQLEGQPQGVQRHLLRRAIALLRPGLRDVDFEAVERGLSFLQHPTSNRRMDLISGLGLTLEAGRLWLAAWEADLPGRDWPQVPESAAIELEVPGHIQLPGGWELHAEYVPFTGLGRAKALSEADPYQAWVDPSGLELPLKVRARRPGDRIRPLGMQGHSLKLSDYMINVKLPRRARSRWPLVFSGEEIVWIPGFLLADAFRLKQDGQDAVRLRLGKS